MVFAATVLFSAPPVVFSFLMQRYFVSGLTSGAPQGVAAHAEGPA
jgi:ABC-type glycerol-3-phosphate transport system permease component